MELIKKLEGLGYRIILKGDKVCYEFVRRGKPNPKRSAELLRELKERKDEVLNYLRFKQIDNVPVSYLPHEIEHLVKINATADEIRKIHALKKMFPSSKIV